ncbi:MAG: monothiol bacilliredoxin BrxC family protein [Ignavibacteria bacterium]
MNWINLDSKEQLNEVKELSKGKRVLVMKYSPIHGVDHIVRTLLEREWNEGEMRIKTYLLDTDANMELAKHFDNEFGLTDETPQLLILENSKPVFDGLHGKVIYSEIRKFAN